LSTVVIVKCDGCLTDVYVLAGETMRQEQCQPEHEQRSGVASEKDEGIIRLEVKWGDHGEFGWRLVGTVGAGVN
jgi:hypothetical protein